MEGQQKGVDTLLKMWLWIKNLKEAVRPPQGKAQHSRSENSQWPGPGREATRRAQGKEHRV